MRPHIAHHLLVDALRGAAQGELAQRGQIARLKIMPDRAFCLLRDIDLAFAQTLDEILGREIDDLHIVSACR